MDNQYDLILQNSNGRMSLFLKDLNGQYGMVYRKERGGEGLVFQDRYQSVLVQEDKHLSLAIGFVLKYPIRAKLVKSPSDYPWSSLVEMTEVRGRRVINKMFLMNFISDIKKFVAELKNADMETLPVARSPYGDVLGDDLFYERVIRKFESREVSHPVRVDSGWFEPKKKVVRGFEEEFDIKLKSIDIHTYQGKRLRGTLLVRLKEMSGLTYREIKEISLFDDVKLNSMGKLYRDNRLRLKSNRKKKKLPEN